MLLPPISRLPEALQRYFWIDQFRTPFIINVVLNGLIAWFLFASLVSIPLWGGEGAEASIAPDLLITAILLPLLICLITTPLIISQVGKGKVPAMPADLLPRKGPGRRPLIVRAVLLALVGITIGALPLIAGLSIVGVESLSPWQMIIMKALWAGVLAAMVSPWIAWWAVSDASNQE